MTPEGWQAVKLGDVMTATIGGGTPDRSNVDYWGGSIPWATVKDFGPRVLSETQEHITEEGLRNSASNLVPANTVVVATRMNVGAVFRSGVPIAINQDLRALVPAQTLSADYLFYFLQTSSRALCRLATGTTVKGLRVNTLRSLFLPLPPLPEQRKIAAILSSLDDAIEKTQAVIDQVQVVKRGLMQELLTRGLPGRHTRFKQTEIGEIPEEWQLKRLAEVARVQTGLAKNKANAGPLSVPYLRVAKVQDGFLNLREMKSVEVNADALSRYALKIGDVLFTEGGDADKLGRGAVWNGEIEPCLHQNHIFVARLFGDIRPMFLSLYGGSSRGKSYFLNCSKQTTNLASMNSTQLKRLPVPIPRLDEQEQISEAPRRARCSVENWRRVVSMQTQRPQVRTRVRPPHWRTPRHP